MQQKQQTTIYLNGVEITLPATAVITCTSIVTASEFSLMAYIAESRQALKDCDCPVVFTIPFCLYEIDARPEAQPTQYGEFWPREDGTKVRRR
jgi:hypothetical protein